ncbi:hypothetical protein BGZ63DRAFT_390257 [Mariannaea sp. PMI_226]|nr:hypothetical protein BGZ63DRAFT_390257 [Mariannaea sp. PMI_226]
MQQMMAINLLFVVHIYNLLILSDLLSYLLAIAGVKAANFQFSPKKTVLAHSVSNIALKPDFPTITTGPGSTSLKNLSRKSYWRRKCLPVVNAI